LLYYVGKKILRNTSYFRQLQVICINIKYFRWEP